MNSGECVTMLVELPPIPHVNVRVAGGTVPVTVPESTRTGNRCKAPFDGAPAKYVEAK